MSTAKCTNTTTGTVTTTTYSGYTVLKWTGSGSYTA
jgi:hypothetical protein